MKKIILKMTLCALWFACKLMAGPEVWAYPPFAHPSAVSRALILSNEVSEAILDAKRRVEVDPDDGLTWINLSTAYLLNKEENLAIDASRRAIRLGHVEQAPILALLLLKHKKSLEAQCLLPHLEAAAQSVSLDGQTRMEAVVLLVSYSIAKSSPPDAIKWLSLAKTIRLKNSELMADSFAWLEQQAGSAELAEVRSRLIGMQLLLGSTAISSKPGVNKWVGGSGHYDAFTKEDVTSGQSDTCNEYPVVTDTGELSSELKLASQGKVAEAASQAEKIVARRPGFARAWRFLGTCYHELGDNIKSFQCTSNAVVLGDGLAVINLASIADDTRNIALWKSLRRHLEFVRDDWQQDYCKGRIQAFLLLMRCADATNDGRLMLALVDTVPLPLPGDQIQEDRLVEIERILTFSESLLNKRGLQGGRYRLSECRRLAKAAASSTR